MRTHSLRAEREHSSRTRAIARTRDDRGSKDLAETHATGGTSLPGRVGAGGGRGANSPILAIEDVWKVPSRQEECRGDYVVWSLWHRKLMQRMYPEHMGVPGRGTFAGRHDNEISDRHRVQSESRAQRN